jgi:hypothetical protein
LYIPFWHLTQDIAFEISNPGLQLKQVVAPTSLYFPVLQVWQGTVPSTSLYVPAEQFTHAFWADSWYPDLQPHLASAAAVQVDNVRSWTPQVAAHAEHAVAPYAGLYVPVEQFLHVEAPIWDPYVPSEH